MAIYGTRRTPFPAPSEAGEGAGGGIRRSPVGSGRRRLPRRDGFRGAGFVDKGFPGA